MSGSRGLRVGFVATRIGGADGVSREIETWERALVDLGHEPYFFGGMVDRPAERSRVVPEASFSHPDVAAINVAVFGDSRAGRPAWVGRSITALAAHLKERLAAFAADCGLDLLLPENTLAIPMNLPLGLAITAYAAESGMPVLAHHHDLPWERQRFLVNSVGDIISAAFPPSLPNVRHVCINSAQRQQLAMRTGLIARLIPNVMDYDTPPPPPDDYARGLRQDLGIAAGEVMVLQPTRVVPRKGIEHSVELVRRLGRPARLVVLGDSADESMEYETHIRAYTEFMGVDVVWAADRIAPSRGTLPDGRAVYSLADAYDACDLITYPSVLEGFGKAILAAAYHRRLIFVNRFLTYDLDIRPRGLRCIEMDGFLTESAVAETRSLLDDPARIREWTDRNFEVGRRFFSMDVLRSGLAAELGDLPGLGA